MSQLKKWTKDFSKDMLVYGLMSALSRVTGLLLLPFLTRVFTTSEYGIIDIIAVSRGLLATLACLSLMNAIYRYFHHHESFQDKKKFISGIYLAVLITATIIMIAGIISSEIISKLILGSEVSSIYLSMAFIAAVLYSLSYISEALLRIERKIVKFNILNITYSVSYALLIMFFVMILDLQLIGVFLADIAAGSIKLILGLIWSRQYLTYNLSISYLTRSLRFSLPILPADLINWVSNQIDRFILLYFLGLSAVGILGAATRIAIIGQFLTTIFRQAWAPYSMSIIKAERKDRDSFYQQAMLIYSAVFASVGLLITCFSPEIFSIIVPPKYYQGHILIPWIIGAASMEASRSITSIGVSISERSHLNFYAASFGVCTNITLALVLIPILGIRGAVIGSFVSQLFFTSSLVYFSMRHAKIDFMPQKLLIIVVIYSITALVMNLISEFIQCQPFHKFYLSLRFVLLFVSVLLIIKISQQILSIKKTAVFAATFISRKLKTL